MECSIIPSQVIATCFSMIGFAAAVVVGLSTGNAAEVVIFRAIVTMLICWLIGRAVGALVQRVIDEHIIQYKTVNPIHHGDDEEGDQPELRIQTDTVEGESLNEKKVSNSVQPTVNIGVS